MCDIYDRRNNNTRRNTQMTDNTEPKQLSLFQVIVEKVGEVAKEQKLTLPYILGELDLVKKHVTDSVLANLSKASEQTEGDDTQEQGDASPDEAEDKA